MSGSKPEQLGLFDAPGPSPEEVAPGSGSEASGTAPDASGTAADDPHAAARAADREARRLAQTEFARPLLVEAGAGTGKTTTLTARILAWCLGAGWERAAARLEAERSAGDPVAGSERIAAETLGGVVAITFTEAAAAEMAQRVGAGLSRVAVGELPLGLLPEALPSAVDERGERARALVGTLDHLTVRTIHAYCRSLLAAHPLEARLHPDLEVDADGRRVEEIAREVVEARLGEAYGVPGDPDVLMLAGRGHGPAELVEALAELVGQHGAREEDFRDDPFAPGRVAELLAGLEAAVADVSTTVAHRFDGATRSGTTVATADALAATEQLLASGDPGGGALDLLRTAVALWGAGELERLRVWGKGRFNKTELACLGGEPEPAAVARAAATLHGEIVRLAELDPELLGAARRAFGRLVGEVRGELRRRGVATFEDLLHEARDLLASEPGVTGSVRRSIDQLLVDEFQDTDRQQCDLVALLGLAGPEAERPGLFLVGDPKQSIYGWRNADLAAYDAFRRRLGEAGGRAVSLSENFRSVPAILDEVTRTIAPVMHEEEGRQPPFVPLVPCEEKAALPGFRRDGSAAGWSPVELWVSWQAGAVEGEGDEPAGPAETTRSAEATALEAEAIARDMARLVREEGVAPEEMALLVRSTSDLDVYLEALRREGVPFAVTGDRQYFRRREVIDAAALVRTVLDPGDHLALVAFLRSPVVGVPDAALLPLWQRGFPGAMSELVGTSRRRLDEVSALVREAARNLPPAATVPGLDRLAGWSEMLVSVVERLAALRAAFATEPADRFVERLRRLFPLEAVAAARYLGAYRLANLERFFRLLEETLEATGGDATALLRFLRRSVTEARDQEEAAPASGGRSAVQVMTIHKAKGLDFGHVYLGQLHKEASGPPWPVELRRGGGDRVEYRLFGAPTPGLAELARDAERVEVAERVRTLYVAMTRAEERLVLSGLWRTAEPAAGEVDVEAAKSHLDLLAGRFGVPPLDRLWERAARAVAEAPTGGGRRAWADHDDVRWVFPALEDRPSGDGTGHGAAAAFDGEPVALPSVEAVARMAASLDGAGRAALERQERPLGGAASEEAHHLLREQLASRRHGSAEAGDGASGTRVDGREVAMAVGTAVHRLLEELTPEQSLLDRLDELPALLAAAGLAAPRREASDTPSGSPGLGRARSLLERIEAGPLAERLRALGSHVVARELPVLLPPPDEPAPGEAPAAGPVGFVSGSVDLLYRDPETGELVVADYKTDQVADGPELEERSRAYASQLDTYARAVAQALALDRWPRRELWFLAAGRVVVLDEPPTHPATGG